MIESNDLRGTTTAYSGTITGVIRGNLGYASPAILVLLRLRRGLEDGGEPRPCRGTISIVLLTSQNGAVPFGLVAANTSTTFTCAHNAAGSVTVQWEAMMLAEKS